MHAWGMCVCVLGMLCSVHGMDPTLCRWLCAKCSYACFVHGGGDVIIVRMVCAVLCAGTPGDADGWWHTKEPPPFTPFWGSEGRLVLLPAHLGLAVCPDRQPAEEEMGLGGVRGCWLV